MSLDNYPKNTSKVLKDWPNQATMKVMEQPSQGPDLNPVESTWTVLCQEDNKFAEQRAEHQFW